MRVSTMRDALYYSRRLREVDAAKSHRVTCGRACELASSWAGMSGGMASSPRPPQVTRLSSSCSQFASSTENVSFCANEPQPFRGVTQKTGYGVQIQGAGCSVTPLFARAWSLGASARVVAAHRADSIAAARDANSLERKDLAAVSPRCSLAQSLPPLRSSETDLGVGQGVPGASSSKAPRAHKIEASKSFPSVRP